LQFGAGTALAHLAVSMFGKPCQHPCALQQFEVMGKGGGVSGVRKLANHFLIGKDLAGIGATKLEQAAQQRRFVHARQKQDVPRNGGFNQRIQNVTPPAFRVGDQFGGAGIRAVKMYCSRFQPNASRISVNDQCGTAITSKRPARLSVKAALDEQRR
jgi:hypothetical protein